METILATAFGRVIDIQRGESDELTRAVDSIFRGVQEGGSIDGTAITFLLSELFKEWCNNKPMHSGISDFFPLWQVTFLGWCICCDLVLLVQREVNNLLF